MTVSEQMAMVYVATAGSVERPDLAGRIERGLALALAGGLVALGNGEWLVPSQSGAGRYHVFEDGMGCTCPDRQRRQVACKHMAAVRLVLAVRRLADDEALIERLLTLVGA